MTRRAPTEVIADWYDRKTDFLLEKYGPGPRIHYHTGLASPDIVPGPTLESLRAQIVQSQEDMLWRAARLWEAETTLRNEILDVGCGLGGASLFFAQEYGARVTALSPVARHLQLVDKFAQQAGVADRVRTLCCDAHNIDERLRFDAAMTFGVTTYFDREIYFQRLAKIIPRGSWVFMEDTFIGRPEMAAPFNDYWNANIGWPAEYISTAERNGFDVVHVEDVSTEASGFWKLSAAYTELLIPSSIPTELPSRHRSINWQSAIYRGYLDGGLRNLLISYRRR